MDISFAQAKDSIYLGGRRVQFLATKDRNSAQRTNCEKLVSEGGYVKATHGTNHVWVPLSNIAYMVPDYGVRVQARKNKEGKSVSSAQK